MLNNLISGVGAFVKGATAKKALIGAGIVAGTFGLIALFGGRSKDSIDECDGYEDANLNSEDVQDAVVQIEE